GVPQILPHLPDRCVLNVSFNDLKTLLEQVNPLLTALSEESQERIKNVMPSSSIIVRYDPVARAGDAEQPFTRLTAVLTIPCWRGHASLSVHMDKNQLCSLIHRVLGRYIDRNAVGGLKLANNTRSQEPAAEAGAEVEVEAKVEADAAVDNEEVAAE
ncbi:hypothetical protein GGF37_007205, partial [Kickxella alabastrina]